MYESFDLYKVPWGVRRPIVSVEQNKKPHFFKRKV